MAAYNGWNRVPMTVHPILAEIVAKEWGVNGVVSTDAGAVRNMVGKHKYFPGMKEAVAAERTQGGTERGPGFGRRHRRRAVRKIPRRDPLGTPRSAGHGPVCAVRG